jgi:AraC-like DNA-binding protein
LPGNFAGIAFFLCFLTKWYYYKYMGLLTAKEILSRMTEIAGSLPLGEFDKLASKPEPVSVGSYTLYPDFSRSIDAIASLGFFNTSQDLPFFQGLSLTMPRRELSGMRTNFTDGDSFPDNSHNYIEFSYVAKGKFHIRIEGQNHVFRKGEMLLLNQGTAHSEIIWHREAVVFRIQIANSFFDRSLRFEQTNDRSDSFLLRFILKDGHDFSFVRLVPKGGPLQMPPFFKEICTEFLRPVRGSNHLIIGYIERFLEALPAQYKFDVAWSSSRARRAAEFEAIRSWLDREYRSASLEMLVEKFGHGVNYYSRLFRKRTGQTFCRYLRDLRLQKAVRLLVTTQFPVDEIARQTGYRSPSHFYKLFNEKFHVQPSEIRQAPT